MKNAVFVLQSGYNIEIFKSAKEIKDYVGNLVKHRGYATLIDFEGDDTYSNIYSHSCGAIVEELQKGTRINISNGWATITLFKKEFKD